MKKKLRKSTVKPVVKPKIPSRSRILESLTGSDALSILEILADRDAGLAREIDAVAGDLLGEVDVAGVAANVTDELVSLDVDDRKPPLSKLESFVKEHCPRYVALLA